QGAGVRGAKGWGLGLALAFALADRLGGALSLDSAPGEGATATLRLPIVAVPRGRRVFDGTDPLGYAPDDGGAFETAPLTQLERIEAYRRQSAA
ncbi:MAG: hypothetical protein K2Q06_12610, partial [Parvularculaceae bacterium]|nr:hypothetical protein [Parvularculaceae bacterium]